MKYILPVLGALCLLACAPVLVVAEDEGRTTFSSVSGDMVLADLAAVASGAFVGAISGAEAHAAGWGDFESRSSEASSGRSGQPTAAEGEGLPDEDARGVAGGIRFTPSREPAFSGGDQGPLHAFEEDLFPVSDDWWLGQRCRAPADRWMGAAGAYSRWAKSFLGGGGASLTGFSARLDAVLGSDGSTMEDIGQRIMAGGFFSRKEVAVLGLTAGILFAGCYCASQKKIKTKVQGILNCDSLTGLSTLEKFKEECAAHLEEESGHAHAIIQFDISKFKIINDKFGFATGDKLLQTCGAALQSNLTDSEICARCFADQFAALVQYDGLDALKSRVRHIIGIMEQWRAASNLPGRIDIHCGVYIFEGDSESVHDIQQALDLAGYALQAAKRQGKSHLVVYDESMRKVSLLHQDLEGGICAALEKGELQVWFQPKVDMLTNAIIGSEALVRWYHPTRGLLLPGVFMPLFERSGDVLQVDFCIFEQVCNALRHWQKSGIDVSTVSCNFSSQHLERPEFSRKLVEIASRYNIAHGLLEVEITESTMLRNPEAANIQIRQLKSLGFRTTIDDFGSGYSSLGLLQLFAADVIKFDRSFLKRNISGERAQIVLGNMITLTRQLGMSAICEGVETEEQANILMRHGCYSAQGFYYARPMPAREFGKMLKIGKVFPRTV